MSVRIRLKRMGRTHRPFYRVCAMDQRAPRNGRVIEELGYYDPMVKETDARAILQQERIDYWLGVGAQPSGKVAVLIKKYGPNGTHLEEQRAALDRLKIKPAAPTPVAVPLPKHRLKKHRQLKHRQLKHRLKKPRNQSRKALNSLAT